MEGSSSIGLGLDRLGILVVQNPRTAFAVVIALSVLALFGLARAEFDDNINASYKSAHPAYADLSALIARKGSAVDDILVLAEADRPLDADDINRLRDLHVELELLDGVAAVFSLHALAEIRPDGSVGSRLVPENVTDEALQEVIRAVRAHPLALSRAISDDGRAIMMVVIPEADVSGREALRRLTEAIDKATSTFSTSSLAISATGQQKMRFAIADAIVRDQIIFNGGGAVLALAVGFMLFRSWRYTVAAFAPCGFALLWTIGLAGLTGIPITVVTNVVPVLVLVISFADSLHLVFGLRRGGKENQTITEQIEAQIRRIGPACALTSVTTAVAILTLATTGYTALTQLAVLGACATIIAFLAVITVFPLAATTFLKNRPQSLVTSAPGRIPFLLSNATGFLLKRPLPVIMGGVAILLVGIVGTVTTSPRFTVFESLPHGSTVRDTALAAEKQFGGVLNLWIEIEAAPGASFETNSGWLQLRSVHEAAESVLGRGSVFSAITIGRALGRPDVPVDQRMLTDLPPSLLARAGNMEEGFAYISTLVPDPNGSSQNTELFDRLETAVRSAGATRVVGIPMLARATGPDIIDKLMKSIIAAAMLSILIVAAAFRSLSLLPAIALSNLIPVLVTGAFLHLLTAGHMTIPAGLAMTVAFGVAVDDTIHFLNRLNIEKGLGKPPTVALEDTVSKVGQVLAATTLVLVAGISITMFSGFETVRLFGQLMMVILILALFADLIVLPAVILKAKSWWRT
ncbi:RND family transporter [Hoeflea sp. TYP-13]|uniref:RND family transporter n=1 Tax=Hoeflea sp. TYP-13 TaxID=3230023 RepID=UPI0034C69BF9